MSSSSKKHNVTSIERHCMFCTDLFITQNEDTFFCSLPCLKRKIHFQTSALTYDEIRATYPLDSEEKKNAALDFGTTKIKRFKPFDNNRLITAILTVTKNGNHRPPGKTYDIELYIKGLDMMYQQFDTKKEAMEKLDHILSFFNYD